MISLCNKKIVLFDFDDTLCIHPKHYHTEEESKEYLHSILAGTHNYRLSNKSSIMQAFIDVCIEKGLILGLISHVTPMASGKEKLDWVEEQYGVRLLDFCVSELEAKARIAAELASVYDIQPNQILIVDDYIGTLKDCEKEGLCACSPLEVANWLEQYKGYSLVKKGGNQNEKLYCTIQGC